MNNIKNLIKILRKKEEKEILHSLAFMSYNPSIGRVLQKNGVKKFSILAEEIIKDTIRIKTKNGFDDKHKEWINKFRNNIKTNAGKRCSYGQAQKAINVFLKLFYDWGKYSKSKTAKRIIRLLHVPLDSLNLKYFKNIIKDDNKYIDLINTIKKHHNNYFRINNNSLSEIGYEEYTAWRDFFRQEYDQKPILFDIVWALKRLND